MLGPTSSAGNGLQSPWSRPAQRSGERQTPPNGPRKVLAKRERPNDRTKGQSSSTRTPASRLAQRCGQPQKADPSDQGVSAAGRGTGSRASSDRTLPEGVADGDGVPARPGGC